MVQVRGSYTGPDPSQGDGLYRNEIQTDRSVMWDAMGGRKGIIRGGAFTNVAGQLALDVPPFAAVAPERDSVGNELARGYYIWSDTTTRVTVTAGSGATRRDVLVACFVDNEAAGVAGSGGLPVGAHLVCIPGTVNLTEAAIASYVGRGGHVMLSSIQVAASDTQVNSATFGERAQYVNRRRGLTLTSQTGFTVTSALYIQYGPFIEVIVAVTKTSSTLSSGADGNFTNTKFAAGLPANLCPLSTEPPCYGTFNNNGAKTGGWQIDSNGDMWLTDMYGSTSLPVGAQFTCRQTYAVNMP